MSCQQGNMKYRKTRTYFLKTLLVNELFSSLIWNDRHIFWVLLREAKLTVHTIQIFPCSVISLKPCLSYCETMRLWFIVSLSEQNNVLYFKVKKTFIKVLDQLKSKNVTLHVVRIPRCRSQSQKWLEQNKYCFVGFFGLGFITLFHSFSDQSRTWLIHQFGV